MKRTGSAVWNGELKTGSGTVSTDSGVLDKVAYSFGKRFGDDAGSNPEELIAAAHAGCYSMALSNVLGGEGMSPEKIETSATVTLEMLDAGPTITAVHLVVNAKVPGADADAFQKAAEGAKTGCPVSKVLNAEITMDATLES